VSIQRKLARLWPIWAMAAALALAILLPLYLVYLAYAATERGIGERLSIFDRLRAVVAYDGSLDGRAPERKANDLAKWFLGEGTPAMLAAALQQQLRQVAEVQGVELVRASEVEPRKIDAASYLGVRLEMSGTAKGIHGVLERIKTSVPPLFIESLQIRVNPAGDNGAAGEPILSMDIEVVGAAAIVNEPVGAQGESP